MAYINKDVSTMAMPSGMNRMGQFPLDMSSVYYDLEALQAYATSGAVAYVGQILSLVDETNNTVTLYAIKNKTGDLVEIAADVSMPEYSGEGAIDVANYKINVVVDNETIKIVDGKLTAIIPEVEIPEYVDTNTTYSFAFDKVTQKLTVTPSEGKAVELDLSDFLIASELPEDKNTEYHLEYDSNDQAIKLVTGADANKMSIDATPFIKDSMLSDVEYDAASNTLTFVWNTDSGLQADTVVLSDILDPYTAGDKIVIDGSKISHATVAAPTEATDESGARKYLTSITTDGHGHITGFTTATESVVDSNDTYSAGDGISVTEANSNDDHIVSVKLGANEEHLKFENGALVFDPTGIDTDTTYSISVNNATITLTPSDGEAQEVTLDVYTKGQTDQAIADKINEVNGGESAGEVLSNLNAYKKNIDTEIWGSDKVSAWTGEDGKYNPDYTETSRIDDLITSVTNLEEVLNDKIDRDDVNETQFEWVDNKLTIKSIDVAVVANLESLLNEKADKTTVNSLSELVNEIDGKVTDLTTILDNYVLKSDYQTVESDVALLKEAMTWGPME